MSKLITTLPAGTRVKDPSTKYRGQPIDWTILEHGHHGAGTTDLISTHILALKAFDAKEPTNADQNRKNYGNNNYKFSNLLQWLNSDKAAGTWFVKTHTADQSPDSATYVSNNPYSQEAGFLSGFSTDFRDILIKKGHVTGKNTVTDGGGTEIVESYIFLLSTTELGLGNQPNAEGTPYAIFSSDAARQAKPTALAVTNSDYQNGSFNANAFWHYWTRTANPSNSYHVYYVHSAGHLNDAHAYFGSYGARPACIISSVTLVSDNPDSDGAYIIMYNEPPVIQTVTTLGDKNGAFDITYSVTDAENESCTAKVELKASPTQTVTLVEEGPIVLGNLYTAGVTQAQLTALEIGNTYHIYITAKDTNGNTSVADVTFTRSASTVIISGVDSDLGDKWQPFTLTYVVTDTDADATQTVTEYVDAQEVRSYTNTPGATNTFQMNLWSLLSNEDEHTLKIDVLNSQGARAIRTYTFTKLGDKLRFATKPQLTDVAAKSILVTLQTESDGPATLLVEASNNAAASEPVWEDITDAVEASVPYVFTNAPSEGVAVAVRVTMTKGAACSRVYANAIGFAIR